MKKTIKLLCLVASLGLFALSACKKKVEDVIYVTLPSENITTYTGKLGYNNNDGSLPIANDTTGKATIAQSDKVVTITFSNNVPTVTGIKFIKNGADYVSVAEDGSAAGITFTGNSVKIAVSNNGKSWGFEGKK
jgi:hypothetical protein